MKGHQPGLALNAVDQGRQVRETTKELRLCAYNRVVQLVDDPVATGAARQGNQPGNPIVGKKTVDIAGPLGIRSSKVAITRPCMGADFDLEPKRLQSLNGNLHGFALIGGIGRTD